jgi:hypothetical protein
MTLKIKTSISETGARQHLLEVLPALRALPDSEAVDALEDLYGMGAKAGIEQVDAVTKELGQWLARLVVAHTKKDALAVKGILDEFVAARCIVKGGPNATPQH